MLALWFVNHLTTKQVHSQKTHCSVFIHKACPEGIQPCTMKNRDIYWRYKKHCTKDNDASVPFKVPPWDLTQFSQSPSAAPSYFPESHWWSKISSLSKVILVLGKARSRKAPNLGCRGSESSGWFDVLPKISEQDMMHEWVCCHDKAANHQLHIAVAVFIVLHLSADKDHWGSAPY